MAPHGDEHQTIQMNTAIDFNNINNNIYNYKKDKKVWPIVDKMIWTSENSSGSEDPNAPRYYVIDTYISCLVKF